MENWGKLIRRNERKEKEEQGVGHLGRGGRK
jgi:hypothetical protein